MSVDVLLPALIAALAGLLTTASHRRLRPPIGARLLAVTMVAVVVAVLPAILVLGVGYLSHLPAFGGALSWCREGLGLHHPVPTWLGGPALVLLGIGGVRLWRLCRTWKRFRCRGAGGVEVVPNRELFAYTMPGPAGRIVVSSGLVDTLDAGELSVVVAHERAHVRHRHDRYVLLSSAAVAVLPVLVPLQRRLRFALERWADEQAMADLAVEPRSVARILASVALSGAAIPAGAVGVAGLGVADRVTALLNPPVTRRSTCWVGVGAAGVVAVLGAAAVQAHHLLPLLASMCLG